MIIDFHTHTFPDAIAASSLAALNGNSGVTPLYDGTANGLSTYLRENAIHYGVVLSIATNARQQTNVNNFAATVDGIDNLIGFGSVYPTAENAFEELDRIKTLGLRGIKLHPDYQSFFVDDERFFPLYRHIAQLGLITVFHAGQDIGYFEPIHATPERLARALPHFNGAPVVAAHYGGYLCWNDVETYLVGRDIYFDTAYSYSRIPYPQAKRIIQNHGANRVLMGSDMPWNSTTDEIRLIESMKFSDWETEELLGGNARRLLGL